MAVFNAAVEALAAQHSDLDLDHVEPAGVLWGVVELQATQDAMRLGRGEGLVEGARRVGRQIVLYHPDAVGVGIMDVDEIAHALGVVFGCLPIGDLDGAPGAVGIEEDEQVGRAVAAVLAVVAFELARSGRDGLTDLTD